jgi:hypothetical protein
MGRINANAKGKVGEREVANWITKNWNIPARRGQQFKGTKDSPDVIVDIDGLHLEVKRVEKLNVSQALERCKQEAGDKVPVLFHRRNREKLKMTVFAEDFDAVVHAIFRGNNERTKV